MHAVRHRLQVPIEREPPGIQALSIERQDLDIPTIPDRSVDSREFVPSSIVAEV